MTCIASVLRVDGISIGHFDPTVEIRDAIDDFIKIRESVNTSKQPKLAIRLDLLIYCHATELSTPYHILYNLLRCIQGKDYMLRPFEQNGSKYPQDKITNIKQLCAEIGEERLPEFFDDFFDKEIRNAFSHSDYCITDDEFRIISKRIHYKLDDLRERLQKGILFFKTFFDVYQSFLHSLHEMTPKYHLNQRHYEVLELLSNSELGLFGFSFHISNGTKCTFYRQPHEVWGMNFRPQLEGMGLQVGNIDELKKEYRIEGKRIPDMEKLLSIKCKDTEDHVSHKTLEGHYPLVD